MVAVTAYLQSHYASKYQHHLTNAAESKPDELFADNLSLSNAAKMQRDQLSTIHSSVGSSNAVY